MVISGFSITDNVGYMTSSGLNSTTYQNSRMNIESTELQNSTETAIGYIPGYAQAFIY